VASIDERRHRPVGRRSITKAPLTRVSPAERGAIRVQTAASLATADESDESLRRADASRGRSRDGRTVADLTETVYPPAIRDTVVAQCARGSPSRGDRVKSQASRNRPRGATARRRTA
jgi:hypothetical protein